MCISEVDRCWHTALLVSLQMAQEGTSLQSPQHVVLSVSSVSISTKEGGLEGWNGGAHCWLHVQSPQRLHIYL